MPRPVSPRRRGDLAAILSASDPEATFEAARALGSRGVDTLPELLEVLHELAAGEREAPVWGLASAITWVLQLHLEAYAAKRAPLDEEPLNEGVDGLGAALARLQPGVESAAIKIGTIVGDELPRAASEFLTEGLAVSARARLLERCRKVLEVGLGGSSSAVIGALTGLSQLASYVGPAMIRPAVEQAAKRATDAKVTEVARWALTMLEDAEA